MSLERNNSTWISNTALLIHSSVKVGEENGLSGLSVLFQAKISKLMMPCICLQFPWVYIYHPLVINSTNCQIGFAVATIGWILGTTAMGFVEWRVWYLDNASQFSGLACMGMWRVCVFRQTNITTATSCHSYSYHDTYLPLDIRVSQHLLLMASILGLLGKAFVTFPLKMCPWEFLRRILPTKLLVSISVAVIITEVPLCDD